jgi:hypothetical protein
MFRGNLLHTSRLEAGRLFYLIVPLRFNGHGCSCKALNRELASALFGFAIYSSAGMAELADAADSKADADFIVNLSK